MISWYLQIGDAAPVPFADFGASGLKYSIGSQKAGSFGFTCDGAAADSNPLLSGDVSLTEGTLCIVWYGTTGPTTSFFSGRLHEIPRKGSGAAESVEYELLDAWHDFERNVYQQQWYGGGYLSECILGMEQNGTRITNGQVIQDVVAYLTANNLAICQLGVIDATSPIPLDEVTDLPCGEVIKKMLRWTPDAVAWFDYTVSPPKFNVTRRGNCTPVNLSFQPSYPVLDSYGNLVLVDSLDIKALPDLVANNVVVRFIQVTKASDGSAATTVTPDVYPPGSTGTEYGAMVLTCRLAEGTTTFQKQTIKTQAIPWGNSSNSGGDSPTGGPSGDAAISFWQRKVPWLKKLASGYSPGDVAEQLVVTNVYGTFDLGQGDDDGSGGVTIGPTVPDGGSAYQNEIIQGSVAPWMSFDAATGEISALVSYCFPASTADYTDQDDTALTQFGGPVNGTRLSAPLYVSTPITVTEGTTGTYSELTGYTAPEAVPAGLAEQIHGAVSVLHYAGSYTTVAQEVSPWTLGLVLNFTGGRAEWAGMNALLQEVSHDLDSGKTTLKFGPPGHVTLQDLMELLRANRSRTVSSHVNERKSGGAGDASEVDGPTQGLTGGGGSAPTNNDNPWEGAEVDQDGNTADDITATYDVVLGYGQSSIVQDSLPNPAPIQKLEISSGNDVSGWTSTPDSCGDLHNVFSMVTGDATYSNDRLWHGAMDDDGNGGSFRVSYSSGGPVLVLSPNLNPDDDTAGDQQMKLDLGAMIASITGTDGSYIHQDLSAAPEIDIYSATGDSNIIDSNSITMTGVDGDTEIQMTGSDGGIVDIDTGDVGGDTAQFQEITYLDNNGYAQTITALCTEPTNPDSTALTTLVKAILAGLTWTGTCNSDGTITIRADFS